MQNLSTLHSFLVPLSPNIGFGDIHPVLQPPHMTTIIRFPYWFSYQYYGQHTRVFPTSSSVACLFPTKKCDFLSSSRNNHTSKIGEPLTRVKCEVRKQTSGGPGGGGENMTALSLDILRHTEMLQPLLKSIEDNEILEIVSLLLFPSLRLDTDDGPGLLS